MSSAPSNPRLQRPGVFGTLGADGLHIESHTANIDLKWVGMQKVRETAEFFMFYYSKRCAYYLPKRAVRGERELDSVREWIRDHLPEGSPFAAS